MTEADDLRARLESVRAEALERVAAAADLHALEEARVRVLGRKAPLSQIRSGLGKLDEDERRSVGRIATEVQRDVESAIDHRRATLEASAMEVRWADERIDVTLPGAEPPLGSLHPLTKTIWEIVDIFIGLGYRLAEGPEVELSAYNFDALNTPPEHPARSPQDTFYIAGSDEQVCLRTQTSPVQIRTMESQQPPVYVVCPGRVFRRDEQDPTHLSGFAQLEGLAVDDGITMGDLRGSLEAFAHQVFGRDLDIRLRPHHFPFTEPSAEMDVQCFVCRGRRPGCRMCKGEGWIEILGCGMVHPFLLECVGYDPDRYTGFAFGMGVERIAALAHGITDIRYLWENDLRFLSRFAGVA
ncbi:MAG TPA: phenylalanine--tRNA ligase subunit alpha [Actinomycetota bacterium]|nr:phenylalanine--tRNA ligase subunit alpha [Actinomycetota bacterium]